VKPRDAFDVDVQWFSDPAASAAGGADDSTPDPAIEYHPQISPALRSDKAIREALKDSPKLNDLVKNYAGAKARLSRALIVPNAEKPDPEEVKAFRAALDIPDGPTGYTLVTDAFKDVQGVEEVVKMVQERAAKHHMSKSQGQGLFETIMGLSKAGRDAGLKAANDAKEAFAPELVRTLGGDEKKAEAAVNLMKSFLIKHIGSQRLVDKLTRDGYIYDPEFALKAAGLEELLGEEPFIKGGGAGKGGKAAPRGTQGHYSPQFQEQFGPNRKES
jgi:hypothetical protein